MTAPLEGHPVSTEREALARQHWATARGFDMLAPHWDDLDEVTREQVRRIVTNVSAGYARQETTEPVA